MSLQTLNVDTRPATAVSPVRRRFAWTLAAAAAYTYALIVFGGIVRITGSGMGCGDDWPRCHGQWIPPLDFDTLIEYTHRLLAAGLFLPFGAVLLYALRHRSASGMGGRGGVLGLVVLAFGLLAFQVLLGALTVKLELPASTTVLHFVTASLLLAALIAAAQRAAGWWGRGGANARFGRVAGSAAALGLLAVAFGALTANTGAAPACQGFPLCNGAVLPSGPGLVHIHWAHRLLAFLLFFHVSAGALAALRRGAPRAVVGAALVALALVAAQLAVAAALVLLHLPRSLQSLHLAMGVAVWGALVVWAGVARSTPRSPAALTPAAPAL